MKKVISSGLMAFVGFSSFGFANESASGNDDSLYPVFIALAMIIGAMVARFIAKKKSARAR